ncbi:collagen-like protein [Euryarchaeota archaeon]|nr:collagen-like protein [Euryarchaeota archaeon]
MTPQTITVSVLVETGIPAYFVLEGCQGAVPAGILCAVTHTLYDQFGNEIIDNSEAGDFTWTTTNGNYSESTDEYFPDHVGDWYLNLTSTSGASGSLMITVDHGQMASLELAASSTSITADEQVWINTTRIDVRGNRLPVLLELDNWVTPQDSQLLPGAPAIWSPTSRGAKIIQATYETITSEITVTVQEGAIVSLILIVDNNVSTWQNFDITSDDILDVKVKAYDQKDNRWIVSANWSLLHPDWTSQTALEQLSGDETSFVPYLASTEHYTITAVYDDGTMTHQVSINVTVSHGDLNSVSIVATGNDGLANTVFDITSDEHIDFTAALADLDTNPIDSSILGWYLTNLDTGDTLVITDELLANGMRWDASAVGNWSISASAVSDSGYNISDAVSVSVVHGKAVLVEAVLDATTQTAGQEITMVVTGTDSDGNTFPQLVEWLENDVAVANITAGENEGTYVYLATTAGAHSLKYTTGSTDATVVVTVEAQRIVDSLQIDISSTTVDQLSNFTVTVKAFDMYLNQIEVPPSANIDATGRAEVLQKGPGVWNVITLDDGQQTVTITAGKVTEERNIEVEGNIGGFFKAGGPLYYVGTGLLVIVSIVLLGLLVSVLRGGDSGYDDDDDEYDYDDEDDSNVPTGPTPGPSGPAPTSGPTGPAPTSGPTGPAPETKEVPPIEQEDTSWQVEHRVDDDGTEWAEDENGTWWYRQEGDADWGEWKE